MPVVQTCFSFWLLFFREKRKKPCGMCEIKRSLSIRHTHTHPSAQLFLSAPPSLCFLSTPAIGFLVSHHHSEHFEFVSFSITPDSFFFLFLFHRDAIKKNFYTHILFWPPFLSFFYGEADEKKNGKTARSLLCY